MVPGLLWEGMGFHDQAFELCGVLFLIHKYFLITYYMLITVLYAVVQNAETQSLMSLRFGREAAVKPTCDGRVLRGDEQWQLAPSEHKANTCAVDRITKLKLV